MSEYGAQCITAALELILSALCMLVTVQQSLQASKEACTRAPASATFRVGLEATVRTMPHREERLIPPQIQACPSHPSKPVPLEPL